MRSTPLSSALPSLGFAAALFATASVAHACGGHGPPDSISTLPGIGFYRPDVMLLLPILSGAIERPFYSLAGYRTATLGYSIQANFLGAIVANIVGFAGMILFYYSPLMLGVFLVAPFVSLWIKHAWISRVPREDGGRSATGMFLVATIVSTATIASLPLMMHLFGTDTFNYAMRTADLRSTCIVLALIATIATHIWLFGTVKRLSEKPDPRRGFDVLPADAVPLASVV